MSTAITCSVCHATFAADNINSVKSCVVSNCPLKGLVTEDMNNTDSSFKILNG